MCQFLGLAALLLLPRNFASADPLDAHGRLLRHGKPFLVVGWYSDGDIERLRRIGKSPFNTVLDYGLTARSIEETRKYLDEADRLGVAVILCVNDVYPSAKYRTTLGDWKGNDAILEGVVRACRDHPAALAWYTNDELPFELAGEIRGYYDRIKALDPLHPQFLAHFKVGGFEAFKGAADIFGIDNYPIPKKSVEEFAAAIDQARLEVGANNPVWAIIQNFAWYQHKDIVPPLVAGDVDTPRSRIPTPEEWETGRPPTFDEVRAMTYLAIVHGAQGLLYWSLYNLEYLPDREERWRAAMAVAEEVRALEAVVLAPGGERITTKDARIRLLRKSVDGTVTVIAVNASKEPVRFQLDFGQAVDNTVEVVFERRKIALADGAATDFFPPLGRHVYRVKLK